MGRSWTHDLAWGFAWGHAWGAPAAPKVDPNRLGEACAPKAGAAVPPNRDGLDPAAGAPNRDGVDAGAPNREGVAAGAPNGEGVLAGAPKREGVVDPAPNPNPVVAAAAGAPKAPPGVEAPNPNPVAGVAGTVPNADCAGADAAPNKFGVEKLEEAYSIGTQSDNYVHDLYTDTDDETGHRAITDPCLPRSRKETPFVYQGGITMRFKSTRFNNLTNV